MAEKSRRLPMWFANQSVSSSTSAVAENARSLLNGNEEVTVVCSDSTNGAHDVPTSSGSIGPLRVVYDLDEVVDSCRNSNGDTVSSEGDRQVVSGTSDRSTAPQEDEQVDSTSDGASGGPNAPDSSLDVSVPDDNQAEVGSSGVSSNQDEVSSAQSSHARDSCFYGSSCYRHNPQHRQEFSHPGDADYVESTSNASSTKPICKYGQGCFRKNPKHRRDYNHDVPAMRAARPTTFANADDESTDGDFGSGSSDDFSPRDSETDDSFVVSDSFESESESEFSASQGNATNGSDVPNRKRGKRSTKDKKETRKRTKH